MKARFGSKRCRRGQAIVEFALVVPLLITLMLGIVEMGWVIRNSVTINNAAREGSRAAALGKQTADISARITNYAYGLSPSVTMEYCDSTDDPTNSASWTHSPTWPADDTTNGDNGVGNGDLIRITVSITHNQLTGFIPGLTGITLKQKSIMRREST